VDDAEGTDKNLEDEEGSGAFGDKSCKGPESERSVSSPAGESLPRAWTPQISPTKDSPTKASSPAPSPTKDA
jgi:hypothetical protein